MRSRLAYLIADIGNEFQPETENCLSFLESKLAIADNELLHLTTIPHTDSDLKTARYFKTHLLLTYVERYYAFRPAAFNDESFKNKILSMTTDYPDIDSGVNDIKFIFAMLNDEERKKTPLYILMGQLSSPAIQVFKEPTGGLHNLAGQLIYKLASKELIERVRVGALDDFLRIRDCDDYLSLLASTPGCENLRVEFCEAVFDRLNEIIQNKLKMAQANKQEYPWELGYFGSRTKLQYQNHTYQVPRPIHSIKDLIDSYYSTKSTNTKFGIKFDAQTATLHADITLRRIENLLDLENGQTRRLAPLASLVRTAGRIIGTNAAESTVYEYDKMRRLTM